MFVFRFNYRSKTVLLLAALALTVAGCGGSEPAATELGSSELLELLEEQQYDPQGYIEVDLGRFRVTHPLAEGQGQLSVQFHLFGILPEKQKAALEALRPHYENRMRDAVISLVQQSETEHLTDPGLAFFRAEMVNAINRVFQDRVLRDVAFSEYSTDDGFGIPWQNAPDEGKSKKKSSGHGGHGH
jgi:flagellar basal body-associated protein FliL